MTAKVQYFCTMVNAKAVRSKLENGRQKPSGTLTQETVVLCLCRFKKAFDLIDRESLWLKLLAHGITGNVLRVVCTLYGPVTSFVRHLSE